VLSAYSFAHFLISYWVIGQEWMPPTSLEIARELHKEGSFRWIGWRRLELLPKKIFSAKWSVHLS